MNVTGRDHQNPSFDGSRSSSILPFPLFYFKNDGSGAWIPSASTFLPPGKAASGFFLTAPAHELFGIGFGERS